MVNILANEMIGMFFKDKDTIFRKIYLTLEPRFQSLPVRVRALNHLGTFENLTLTLYWKQIHNATFRPFLLQAVTNVRPDSANLMLSSPLILRQSY